MIASEAEAVGKFVGDCISTPIVQAGTLLSVLGYMLYIEPRLGLVVLLIAGPQIIIVPIVQSRINKLVKERARTVRRAGDLIVENMQGGGGSSANTLGSKIGEAFETIFGVRLRVFKLKFGLKGLVSGLQSVGVFALLFFGGIMVLQGKTEIGIVVAFISGLDRVPRSVARTDCIRAINLRREGAIRPAQGYLGWKIGTGTARGGADHPTAPSSRQSVGALPAIVHPARAGVGAGS